MKTKREYRQACKIAQQVIDEIDPYSLLAHGAPADEFDCIAAAVVRQVPNIRSSDDAAAAIASALSDAFSETFSPTHCLVAGRKLIAKLSEAGLMDSPAN